MRRELCAAVLAWGVALAVSPSIALADEPGGARANVSPEEARAQQFQRVEGPQNEAVPAAPLLFGAYAIIWALLFGYLFLVARRQAETRSEIAALERLVAAKARAADARPAPEASSIAPPPIASDGPREADASTRDAAPEESATDRDRAPHDEPS